VRGGQKAVKTLDMSGSNDDYSAQKKRQGVPSVGTHLEVGVYTGCLVGMGIPKFYRWTSERYPCLSRTIKDNEVRAVGIAPCHNNTQPHCLLSSCCHSVLF
jgi:hypothetical protein